MKVLCTLGYFDDSGEGALVEVDLAAGVAQVVLRHIPPPPLRVRGKGFTGACWAGTPGRSPLWVCGHAALYRVDAALRNIEAIWHQPCMNDLHHVSVGEGRVYLVNTGLESLEVFSAEGQFLGSHSLHPGWVSAARQAGQPLSRESLWRMRDARWPTSGTEHASGADDGYYGWTPGQGFSQGKVRDLFHPNHVALVGDQVLVTRLLDRSVQDMATFINVIAETPGLPHDGEADGEVFWLSCVNGQIVGYAMERGRVTGRLVRQMDLFETTGHTGWCRGLLATPEYLIVGLSEIRRMPRQRWCDRPYHGTETSVLCVERKTGALVARVDLSDPVRHSKLFSILPADPSNEPPQ